MLKIMAKTEIMCHTYTFMLYPKIIFWALFNLGPDLIQFIQ